MNVVELQRALRQLRCSGMAPRSRPACSKPKPSGSCPSISSPASFRTSCSGARTGPSSGGNTLAWGGSPTGRFCPVHNWPVFRCPPRGAPGHRCHHFCHHVSRCG
jgi:hypothetical protein